MRFEKGSLLGSVGKSSVTAVCYRADYVLGVATFYYYIFGYLAAASEGLSDFRIHLISQLGEPETLLQQYVGKFRYGAS